MNVDEFKRIDLDTKHSTGILTRGFSAKDGYVTCDILELDDPSLLEWLRSRGGDNPWAEGVVKLLLAIIREKSE